MLLRHTVVRMIVFIVAQDAFSLQVSFRKRALYLGALLRKESYNLRHPMHLRH